MHHRYRNLVFLLILVVVTIAGWLVWRYARMSPDASSFYVSYLNMVDANSGWMQVMGEAGQRDYLLHTTDGGATWQDVSLPQQITANGSTVLLKGRSSGLGAMNAGTAWVLLSDTADKGQPLYGRVLRTDDGGRTWVPGNPFTVETADNLSSIDLFYPQLYFVDSKHGWLKTSIGKPFSESYDHWFQTSDGGMNWQPFPWKQALVCDRMVADVCTYLLLNDRVGLGGYLSVEGSTVGDIRSAHAWELKRTMDGGCTWTTIMLPVPADLLASSQQIKDPKATFRVERDFASFGAGLVGIQLYYRFDGSGQSGRYDYLSADQGNTWRIIPDPGYVFFLDKTIAWRSSQQASGKYNLEQTTDGGVTWQMLRTDLPWTESLQFVDAQHGWMVARYDNPTDLMRTLDGGRTWTVLKIVLPNSGS